MQAMQAMQAMYFFLSKYLAQSEISLVKRAVHIQMDKYYNRYS